MSGQKQHVVECQRRRGELGVVSHSTFFGLFGEDLRRRRAIRRMRELDARTLADSGISPGGPVASGRWPLKPVRSRVR